MFGCGGDRDRASARRWAKWHAAWPNQVVLTVTIPRSEDPHIVSGSSPAWTVDENVTVEHDRAAAIHDSIAGADAEDLVLIAGPGPGLPGDRRQRRPVQRYRAGAPGTAGW